jgi:hypothetical protein
VADAVYRNTPATVDLDLWAGDSVAMLVLVQENGTAYDLTGDNSATIRRTAQEDVIEDLPVTIDVTDAAAGEATISVAGTGNYVDGFVGVWDWQVTADDNVRTVCRGKVTITADVTR